MNAIISGKVEKPEGSMIFTPKQTWVWTGSGGYANGSLQISEEAYQTQYIRIIDRKNCVFLFALQGLVDFDDGVYATFVAHGTGTYKLESGTKISLVWYNLSARTIGYQQIGGYTDVSIDKYINSVEIGTLE